MPKAENYFIDRENAFRYRVIRTYPEVQLVAGLISAVYSRSGYVSGEDVDLLSHIYYERTDAVTICADLLTSAQVVGTISVVTDQSIPLPMDDVFHPEVEVLRREGLRLAEIRRFAVDKELLRTQQMSNTELSVSITLLGIAVQYARSMRCDMICFMVKSDHKAFYESIGARRLAEERPCPAINNKPVLAYQIDLHSVSSSPNFLLEKIMSVQVPENFFDR